MERMHPRPRARRLRMTLTMFRRLRLLLLNSTYVWQQQGVKHVLRHGVPGPS